MKPLYYLVLASLASVLFSGGALAARPNDEKMKLATAKSKTLPCEIRQWPP
ncbi:MAG: hypothetical protein KDH94_02010 [Coxiellaceae bacterium]|nr:hypothetical protein [Coxiellaceae bacterium]